METDIKVKKEKVGSDEDVNHVKGGKSQEEYETLANYTPTVTKEGPELVEVKCEVPWEPELETEHTRPLSPSCCVSVTIKEEIGSDAEEGYDGKADRCEENNASGRLWWEPPVSGTDAELKYDGKAGRFVENNTPDQSSLRSSTVGTGVKLKLDEATGLFVESDSPGEDSVSGADIEEEYKGSTRSSEENSSLGTRWLGHSVLGSDAEEESDKKPRRRRRKKPDVGPPVFKVVTKKTPEISPITYKGQLFPCRQCEKEFISQHFLDMHSVVAHSYDLEPINEEAEESVKPDTSTVTEKIEQLVTLVPRTFSCCACDKTYSQFKYLSQHVKEHTENTPVLCCYCGMCFTLSSDLNQHMITHTGKSPYTCKYCGKTFIFRGGLQGLGHHYLDKHPGQRAYECSFCDKAFTTHGFLRSHLAIHTDDYQYQCRFCCKRFTRQRTRASHEEIHKKGGTHLCGQCDKLFLFAAHLKKHMRVHRTKKKEQLFRFEKISK